ncbi:peptide ABC transporter substrate-binding protein [Paenibacillus albiflavus]|uniref:Peptide ABC transporter substrate-binding protein n=1 Tax=Paenibacillus albiflavus TaxID=2545760 RepID=A0A4R4EK31_9BACL|nr:peptide ABC transporter substrate-binding protein [Paenibacillus albiflavus]TCZ80097.1 peptide ABC transporter substrate-binding protein [Paenibacillus albiflavus]
MLKKNGKFMLLALMILTLVVGCSSSPKTEVKDAGNATPAPEATNAPTASGDTQKIVYVLNNEADKLDPGLTAETFATPIISNVFEGLVQMNDKYEPLPGVAKEWKVSPDGLVYTFTLRDDAKWSDGSKLTAKDFFYSWKRVMTAETASDYSFMMYPYIKNGEKFFKGEVKEDELGIKVINDTTLEVTLEAPSPYIMQLFAFSCYMPVQQAAVEKDKDAWHRKAETFISNGPFKVKELKFGESYTLVKNENYWGKDNVRLEEVKFSIVPEMATGLTAMESKKVDGINGVPTAEIARLKAGDDRFIVLPALGTTYYLLNNKVKPLDDEKVRKALALAINRKEIVENVTQGGQQPAFALIPNGMTLEGKDFREAGGSYGLTETGDVEAAKKLLAEAGYPDGKGFPKLSLKYYSGDIPKKVTEALQQMWKKNLNIDLELKSSEWKVYYKEIQDYDYGIASMGWGGDYAHPMTFLDVFNSKSPNNMTNWGSSDYDQQVDSAKKELDPAKQLEAMHKAEDILMNEMRILPVYHSTNVMMMAEYVKGWNRNILGNIYFKDAYVEGRGK